MGLLDFFRQRGKASIHIATTKTDAVGGQRHTITCSVSSIAAVTDLIWIKKTAAGNEIVNVVDVDGKFSGGTLSDPSLTINNIVKSDEGIYVCRATNRFGTTSSEDSVVTCKECIEVEIIQKGPITVGYGGTTRIKANIISNSTGSLEINWQKTQNNCSKILIIDCPKYFGSSCQVNNPHLVINSIDKEDAGIYKLDVISPAGTKSSPGILVELYGDEADSLSKEENNFFRLYLLCHKIATQAVLFFFDSEVPVHTLESFLKKHKLDLIFQGNHCKCTREQEAKLFPGGHVAVVSTDFDFSLVYKLIRNLLTGIPPPTCGWGIQPSSGHCKETDDIERIRHFRNLFAHNSKLEICDADFSTHWTDLSEAINRLSKCSLSSEVKIMKTKLFDKCIKNEMEEDMRKDLKEMHENCMDLIQDIHDINNRHIPLHIRKGHEQSIMNWKIADKPFYETGGFTAALEMVQSKNYMTIIGGPGSGKTVTARHIALQLEKQEWEVVPVSRLEEIIQYGDRDHRQVFVFDDVLGIFAVDMNIYNYIIKHKEPIFNAIGGTSKLLFTCRKSLYKETSNLRLFVSENIVDLQSKANQLTETEKMAICQHHCESKGLNPGLYTSLSFTKANYMFPYLCDVFSKDKKYQRLGESFFNKPVTYFIEELDTLQDRHTIQYAVLVLCLVNEGKLSVDHLPPKHTKKEVFNNCGVNLGTPDKTIKDAIDNQSETYFTKLETEYTFTHDFIFEVIACHYGRQNKHQILKYLSSSYIANKVTVYDEDSNEDLCIHISQDMYLPLAERLYKDIQSMNLFDVFMNKSLKHGPFLDVFETMLKTKPFDEFKSLLLRKRQKCSHLMPVNSPIRQMIDDIESERLFLLLDMESGPTDNVKVISWIVNYGHTHLLQEIVNHVECKNHSISLVFGSDIMENRRLLLLGCNSNTLDMVELILNYVDPKCIDIDCYLFSQYTPLTKACAIGNEHIVKVLLRYHADINNCTDWNESTFCTGSWHGQMPRANYLLWCGAYIKFSDGGRRSPLFVASQKGHCGVVKCLLSSGADINLCNIFGLSPLFVASQLGHCDIVKCLLSSGADINLRDPDGQSPSFIVSQLGNCDVLKCLLSSGADINLCNNLGLSPLFVASQLGHCGVVNCLLSSAVDINLCNIFGQSPLLVASLLGHCDIVKCLLSAGADINLRDRGGQSPLFEASQKRHWGVVKCLLSSGADINLCNKFGLSPLFVASADGHCDVVKCLLSAGADINLCDKLGQSPVFIASQLEDCDVFKCLLSSGADINLCNNIGLSPLCVASLTGHCVIVKCLLSAGADINLRGEGGRSPLFLASYHEHFDVVKCLLSSGADINLRDAGGRSPLFAASQKGQCDVVKCLLSSDADINLRNKPGQSPLFIASQKGHCDVVKCLLSSGSDINLHEEGGRSPLFAASMDGHCDVVKCLLSSGANINMCNNFGISPLFIASLTGHCAIIKCLLSSGADINLCDNLGRSPLFVALMSGHCDVVKCLLSSGADINLHEEGGRSPLFVASMFGHCDVVKCSLRSGANINMCKKGGQSPLFVASMSGHCDVVNCLISSGADINLRDEGERSPLFVASMSGHCDVVKCLLSFGADINLRDAGGQSPLCVATSAGYNDIVRLLRQHGALRKENMKAHYKTISKGTNDNENLANSNALLNTCGYSEEEIHNSAEKREEEKEAIYLSTVQEGKAETMHTREQEGKEEIIYTREEKDQTN